MSNAIPPCRTIHVIAFRGDRSRHAANAFQLALHAGRTGRSSGPTALDCLFFAGHAGISMDGGSTVYGFNPDGGHAPLWQLLDSLKNGDAFPGIVQDDTNVFSGAKNRSLVVVTIEIILPEPRFSEFERRLDAERRNSQYSYGFPNGNGDCNCITWVERLGLPLLSGRMDEFFGLAGITSLPRRRFGWCV